MSAIIIIKIDAKFDLALWQTISFSAPLAYLRERAMIETATRETLSCHNGKYTFDLVSRTVDIGVNRRRLDRRRLRIKLLLLLSSFAVAAISLAVDTVYDIPGLAMDEFGYVYGFLFVAFPLGLMLDKKYVEQFVLNKQREGTASRIYITDDAITFNPGDRYEVRLRRSDLISVTRDPRKKGDEDTWMEREKRLMGIDLVAGRRKVVVLDKCLREYDMAELLFIIASWGQSFDQMIKAIVQSGMAHPGNRNYPTNISKKLSVQVFLPLLEHCKDSDAGPETIRIDDMTKPVTERAIAVGVHEIIDPDFLQDLRLLPDYSLYFEWQDGDVYAVFRCVSDMKFQPQSLSDIFRAALNEDQERSAKKLVGFLEFVMENEALRDVVIEKDLLPLSDAQMAAKEVFGLQAPYVHPELRSAIETILARAHEA